MFRPTTEKVSEIISRTAQSRITNVTIECGQRHDTIIVSAETERSSATRSSEKRTCYLYVSDARSMAAGWVGCTTVTTISGNRFCVAAVRAYRNRRRISIDTSGRAVFYDENNGGRRSFSLFSKFIRAFLFFELDVPDFVEVLRFRTETTFGAAFWIIFKGSRISADLTLRSRPLYLCIYIYTYSNQMFDGVFSSSSLYVCILRKFRERK